MPQMWLDRGERTPTPDVIVHPASTKEVAEVVRLANRHRIPLIPWGGGSGTQGGALPIHGGIMLDMKRMNRLLNISERSFTVTAEAGINGGQLEWALNDRLHPATTRFGQLLPSAVISPRRSGPSARNAKAEPRHEHGDRPRRRHDHSDAGRPNHASGPDFMRLFLGSEGTFGVITEATMQITRLPEVRLFRALLFKDVATGLEAGRRLMIDRLDPLVIRMYDPHSTALLVKRVLGYELDGAYMIVGFDGYADIAALQEKRAMAIFPSSAPRISAASRASWWNHR
jgi:alkyldihydroxyacetonephosphate synthase